MKPKRFVSSAPTKRGAKSARHRPGNQIDFSDIPESTEAELRRARRVGPGKINGAKPRLS